MKRSFIPSDDPPTDRTSPGRWFVFSRYWLLVSDLGDQADIPLIQDPKTIGLQSLEEIYLGNLEGIPCYAAAIPDSPEAPAGMSFQDLRNLHERLDQERLLISFRALHLLDWSQKTRFCQRCGGEIKTVPNQRAKECPNCGFQSFPRISPAVIVLVERGDQCLLARSPRFRDGFYSVLAGFAEPGETLEETVEREVREETGIKIKDIRYFGSQPWPFPDSLMIGFTAKYAGGQIRVDGTEILEAQWFPFNQLPKIPGKISIARQLIDWFITKHQTKQNTL